MNIKDIVLFDAYTLNLQSRINDTKAEPEINESVKYTETTKGRLPECISEEVFDGLVVALKQDLIDKGILIKTPVDPCDGCGIGYGGTSYVDGKYVIKTCYEDCQRLKEYRALKEKYRELFGE